MLETDRLILRPWKEEDAQDLYTCAKDEEVASPCGWNAHVDVQDSLAVIRHVLVGPECYAVCLKESGLPIGSIELMLSKTNPDECELGFWIGKEYWGNGYIPEAAKCLLKRGFETLNMNTVWCRYAVWNEKSKRAQEKIGFIYHHLDLHDWMPVLQEERVSHWNYMTKERWNHIKED